MKEIILGLLQDKKYSQLKDVLNYVAPQDLAGFIQDEEHTDLEPYMLVLFRLLSKETAAEVFVELDTEHQEELIKSYTDAELRGILDEMYLDDTVDIVEEMPASVVKRILKVADPAMRQQINDMLKYSKDSVGSIMTVEYVSLKKTMTVAEAFDRIRSNGVDKETIYTCYVLDGGRRPEGIVTAREMLLADPYTPISELMNENVISVRTDQDREEAVNIFRKYGFLALPVLDSEGRMVGIVTMDDAMNVLEAENTEDIEKMAAITPSEKPYLHTGVFSTWLQRIPWLFLLMISGTFTGMIISSFEDKLSVLVCLTAFIPMLMDTGGNSGSQSSVSVIRGLALGDVTFKDFFRVLWKEIRVALLCGISLAAVAFVKVIVIDGLLMKTTGVDWQVALVVAVSLCVTVIVAKTVGCTLPLLAKKLGFDPAIMASPFITTIVDALALLAYFFFATSILSARFI